MPPVFLPIACSGPDALPYMAGVTALGKMLGLVTAVAAAALLYDAARGRRPPDLAAVAVFLAAAHPGWWVSAYHGDCGLCLRRLSITATAAAVGCLALAQVLHWRDQRRGPPNEADPPGLGETAVHRLPPAGRGRG